MLTLLTLMTSLLFASPISEPPQDGDSDVVVQKIQMRMTVEDQDYAWTILIPRGVKKGGAGLLFLHGFGECGEDGEKQLTVGLPPAVMKNPDQWPFVIIAPQKPVFMSEWEDHKPAVLAMLHQAISEGYIDPDRIAITGMSQGGHGAIMFAKDDPEMFRAVAPVCGYIESRVSNGQMLPDQSKATPENEAVVSAAKKLNKLPIWIFHGEDDSVIPYAESKSLHTVLEDLGSQSKLTSFAETDHNSWDQAYAMQELAKWFVEHTD